jgi:acyl carrier protein
MTKEQVLSDIQQIFRKVMKDPLLEVNYHTNMDQLESWDSLTHVILIDAIEKHYTIQFNLKDLLNINDVDAICNSILGKLER